MKLSRLFVFSLPLFLCVFGDLSPQGGQKGGLSSRKKNVLLSDEDQTSVQVGHDVCPDTWFIEHNGTCVCGSSIDGVVQCNEETKEVGILDCYCMTLGTYGNHTIEVVGPCFFNCGNVSELNNDLIYHKVLQNVNGLNGTCSYLHRNGTLCGSCMDGYVPPAYSYSMECIKCEHSHHNWWKFVVVSFLPLTIFILFILVFRISVVSPKLNAFVFTTQLSSIPINIRIFLYGVRHISSRKPEHALKVFATLDGIWNLDFFRTVIPDICLNVNTLQVLALDYLVAFYPMLLMAIAYTLVELHACGFRPVLCVWRPFHRFFARFRRQWDIQTSIMDALITFFLLSTMKLLSTSFSFLIPAKLYTTTGQSLGLYLYYDSNIKYFGGEHLPYALLALTVVALFILLPLFLLLFHPLKCLKRSRWNLRALEDFVHAFQQYYKDGKEGGIDCRWFAGFYILLRLVITLSYGFCVNGLGYPLITIVSAIAGVVVLTVEPYKQEYALFNRVDSVLILQLALWCGCMTCIDFASFYEQAYMVHMIMILGVVQLIHYVYIITVVICWAYKRVNSKCHCQFLKKIRGGYAPFDALPDRLIHSNRYKDCGFGYIPKQNEHQLHLCNDTAPHSH